VTATRKRHDRFDFQIYGSLPGDVFDGVTLQQSALESWQSIVSSNLSLSIFDGDLGNYLVWASGNHNGNLRLEP
jgi:hypothetical protein